MPNTVISLKFIKLRHLLFKKLQKKRLEKKIWVGKCPVSGSWKMTGFRILKNFRTSGALRWGQKTFEVDPNVSSRKVWLAKLGFQIIAWSCFLIKGSFFHLQTNFLIPKSDIHNENVIIFWQGTASIMW